MVIFPSDKIATFSFQVLIFISFDNSYHMRHPHLVLQAQQQAGTGQSLPLVGLGICWNCPELVCLLRSQKSEVV